MPWRHKDAPEPIDVPDWNGPGLLAHCAIAQGRRGRPLAVVELSAGEIVARLRVDELAQFAAGQLAIVESIDDEPLVFLSRVDAAAPTSVAAQQLIGLPADSVVLLVADPGTPPAAVLSAADADRFRSWVRSFPG